MELATAIGDRATELLGRRLRLVALLELGDTPGADAEIEAYARLAGLIRQPLYTWYVPLWRGMAELLAAWDGTGGVARRGWRSGRRRPVQRLQPARQGQVVVHLRGDRGRPGTSLLRCGEGGEAGDSVAIPLRPHQRRRKSRRRATVTTAALRND